MIALGGLIGCGRDPDIVLTTRLPVKPPGHYDSLLYAMCDLPSKDPDDAVRAIFYNKEGHTLFEQTVRCDIVRRKGDPKPK